MESQCIDIINTLAPCLTIAGWDPGLAQFIQILLGVVLVTLALVTTAFLYWQRDKERR